MNLDTVTKIIHLRAAKTTQHAIAKQLGLCTRTVLRVLKKHSHEFVLREIEVMETIFEKSGINHESEVRAQASHLRKLEVALQDCGIDDPNFEKLARMTQKARKLYFDFTDRCYARLDQALEKASEDVDLDEFEPNTDYESNADAKPDPTQPFQPVMVKDPTASAPTDTAKKSQAAEGSQKKESTPSTPANETSVTNSSIPSAQEWDIAQASEIWEKAWRKNHPED